MTDVRVPHFVFPEGTTREEAIFQALGAASVCWENTEAAGEFKSEHAYAVGQALLAYLDALEEPAEEPETVWLNALHCVRPDAEFQRSVGAGIITSLMTGGKPHEKPGDPHRVLVVRLVAS